MTIEVVNRKTIIPHVSILIEVSLDGSHQTLYKVSVNVTELKCSVHRKSASLCQKLKIYITFIVFTI